MDIYAAAVNRLCILFGALVTLAISTSALAATDFTLPSYEEATAVNDNTVGVVFTHEELYHQIVHNMEDELESTGGLRIVPIMGKNHVQSIYDLLFLRGVDLALVRSDAIEYVDRRTPKLDVQNVVRSVVKISDEKIAIVARDEITSPQDLNGKKVSLGIAGSGEYVTGTLVLETLDIDVEAINMRNTLAAQKLQAGELDALVYLLKASDAVQSRADEEDAEQIKALTAQSGLHVLELEPDERLDALYTQTEISHDDLPGLLTEGAATTTYSVDAMLAAYRWPRSNPRYEKVDRFVGTFIDSLDGLITGPYQPVWQRVSIDTTVPNTVRLSLVDEKMEARRLAALQAQADADARREARQTARRQANLEKLKAQEAQITEQLREKLTTSNTAELETLLDELDQILNGLDADGTTPEQAHDE